MAVRAEQVSASNLIKRAEIRPSQLHRTTTSIYRLKVHCQFAGSALVNSQPKEKRASRKKLI